MEPCGNVSSSTAIACGLILNELLSNALKYAFPGGRSGEILLTLRPCGGRKFEFRLKDDGIGLPDGLDCATAESLGLQLVGSFVKHLRGQLAILRGQGTEFAIRFDAR